ncbi:fructose-bisphosphate aldolase class I [Sulfurovum sp. zt1-1]|uniref:Fructose-bisphosphate aldolase n=1 Tax=Sulfurovum zhangzhouensis TaxID=3019067 RepID=A0ABT7QYG4_9BACT|nr:class I fructose-bisphosphate aldolase [Sulfurovum zhangzhouensis]MDM5271837.1 fructose-bisphosphate aldolase class I [Sulfurovum zhangzhouensis]
MNIETLKSVANAIVAKQKGVLAADESTPTIKKRFDKVNVESTEEIRRRYREILFTSEGIERYIGGVILYDETLRQSTQDGIPFPELLLSRGIMPGIKVDKRAKDLALFPGEKITEGLDGLRDQLIEYKELGAKFAKWRAVIEIDEHNIPTDYGIRANAHALARYAALCQELDIVPIVEPEVLMDGSHTIERCEEVTSRVLETVFTELDTHRVVFEGMLLKPNMVIPGLKCVQQESPEKIAEATIRCMRRYVPAAVPGLVFLSGGQSAEDATANLNAMNMIGPHPWEVSFSYGRALQAPVLEAWKGQESNVAAAQKMLLKRCMLNGYARDGQYDHDMERTE